MNPFQPATLTLLDEGLCERFETRIAFPTPEGGWIPTHSLLFVCPACARVWGALAREDSPTLWPRAAPCSACPPPDPSYTPGSVLVNWGYACLIDTELLEALPPALLRREFQLHARRLSQ